MTNRPPIDPSRGPATLGDPTKRIGEKPKPPIVRRDRR